MPKLTLPTPIVTTTWLQQHLHHPNLILLDASIPAIGTKPNTLQIPRKYIPNTRFFDLKNKFSDTSSSLSNTLPSPQQFEQEAQALGINKNSIVVVYDNLGMYSSPRAWWLFQVMGHQQVAVLEGGLPAWEALGLETTSLSEKRPSTGNFKAVFDNKAIITAAEILSSLSDKKTVVVDARSTARFSGAQAEPRAGLQSGHIPGAINLPYKFVLEVLQNGKFRPLSHLKNIFGAFSLPQYTLVFSCGSGTTACIVLLAAQLAGWKNLQLYDGSWSEWGQLEDVPIQRTTIV